MYKSLAPTYASVHDLTKNIRPLLHDKNGPSPMHLNSTQKLCPDLYLNYTSSADKVKPFQVYNQTQFTRALLSTYFSTPSILLSYPLHLSYSMKPLRRTG